MPYPGEHAARIRQPNLFDPNTFRRTSGGKATLPGSGTITIPKTVGIIWGKLKDFNKPSDQPQVQALRFPKKNWTADAAKKWLTDNKVKYISFEPASATSEFNADNTDSGEPPEPDPEMEVGKPILLYMPIYDSVAQELVDIMNQTPSEQDLQIWMNSPGGRVFAGWSIIGPMVKREGKISISVFGHAMSMAVYLCLFADEVEALEVTQFMIHRADGYVENDDDQKLLDNINKDLRKQMETRLNMDVFQEVCGITIDEIFNSPTRKDVMLTAKQAKKLGLIDSIIKLTPSQVKAQASHFVAFADFSERTEIEETQRSVQEPESNNNPKNSKMTLAELRAQHPELVSAIEKDAISAERDRIGSYLAFLDVDKENVVKAIKEGTAFTGAVMAEMTVKLTAHVSKQNLIADGQENPKPVTDKVIDLKSPEATAVSDFEKTVESQVKNINIY